MRAAVISTPHPRPVWSTRFSVGHRGHQPTTTLKRVLQTSAWRRRVITSPETTLSPFLTVPCLHPRTPRRGCCAGFSSHPRLHSFASARLLLSPHPRPSHSP